MAAEGGGSPLGYLAFIGGILAAGHGPHCLGGVEQGGTVDCSHPGGIRAPAGNPLREGGSRPQWAGAFPRGAGIGSGVSRPESPGGGLGGLGMLGVGLLGASNIINFPRKSKGPQSRGRRKQKGGGGGGSKTPQAREVDRLAKEAGKDMRRGAAFGIGAEAFRTVLGVPEGIAEKAEAAADEATRRADEAQRKLEQREKEIRADERALARERARIQAEAEREAARVEREDATREQRIMGEAGRGVQAYEKAEQKAIDKAISDAGKRAASDVRLESASPLPPASRTYQLPPAVTRLLMAGLPALVTGSLKRSSSGANRLVEPELPPIDPDISPGGNVAPGWLSDMQFELSQQPEPLAQAEACQEVCYCKGKRKKKRKSNTRKICYERKIA